MLPALISCNSLLGIEFLADSVVEILHGRKSKPQSNT